MFKLWIEAARPKTLSAAFAPVLMATILAYSEGVFHLWSAIAALFGAFFIQIGTNFANDYFDYKKGGDISERIGPQRLTHRGLVTPNAMKKAMLLSFALAFIIGIYLVSRGGWPIVFLGLSSLLLGVIYTGGPFPLAYHGLGDIFAFLFFGPIATWGTYYVQALEHSNLALAFGAAQGLFSVALLSINNLRDIDEDRKTGKNTLIARFGATFGETEYLASISLALVSPLLFLLIFQHDHYVSLIGMLTFFLFVMPIKRILSYSDSRELLEVLPMTARIQLVFTLLFSLGWLIT